MITLLTDRHFKPERYALKIGTDLAVGSRPYGMMMKFRCMTITGEEGEDVGHSSMVS